MAYALRAIRLFQHLTSRKEGVAWIVGKQFLRSATSIGANLVEAQAGESRADFIHKCSIAQKEARESACWLTLMVRSDLVPETKVSPLLAETSEIVAILTAILVNTKKNGKGVRS